MADTHECQFADANDYADHVEHCLRCDAIPTPPRTPDELAVILFEYPRFLAEYLPLLLHDTPTRRAAVGFIAEVSDGDESASQF